MIFKVFFFNGKIQSIISKLIIFFASLHQLKLSYKECIVYNIYAFLKKMLYIFDLFQEEMYFLGFTSVTYLVRQKYFDLIRSDVDVQQVCFYGFRVYFK